jgi:dCTP deaminase
MTAGVLPDSELARLISAGALCASVPFDADQVQPASLDLRLGPVAHRLRASFLPGAGVRVADRLGDPDLVLDTLDLSRGALLETGAVYLVELMERCALPADVAGRANPKSSTGRIDVFTRVIGDGATAFDRLPAGYAGPLYAEVSPRTFPIRARPGARVGQARFKRGEAAAPRTEDLTLDLSPDLGPVVGFRAKRHAPVLDLSLIGGHAPERFWEPVSAPAGRLVLDPGEFYILASRPGVRIDPAEAAEMAPTVEDLGEFRAHYAGFFDPGFGEARLGGAGARAVLEVRGRDVPFVLEHGQPVARLLHEPLAAPPTRLYGQAGSTYQGQSLKLAKYFAPWA